MIRKHLLSVFSLLLLVIAASFNISATTAPAITTQPANVTVKIGATATFSVVASGTAPLSYQWYKIDYYCTGCSGTAINGATASKYITPATTEGDSASYFYVVVSNSAGSVISNEAKLTVTVPPTIDQQPSSVTVTVPAVATFNADAWGDWPMTCQWYKNNIAISGATDCWSYSTSETTTADNGAKFVIKYKNDGGSVISSSAILTVNPYTSSGTYPIVGEWSGTATVKSTSGGSSSTYKATAAFVQNSYSVLGTIVFTDSEGNAQYGAGVASLNSLNVFTTTSTDDEGGTISIAAGFSSDLLTLIGTAAGSTGSGGSGKLILSSDHKQLTGTATASDLDDNDSYTISFSLTRLK